ncbi:helix-turn-helix transcriptional regulator [Flavivirga aquimarina]|uniref:Helix-turn-helix transcriptional regulator n=1 Tax=Flavivirga aquimarina TaxID=2027862 RepID=A0ABT8WG92_9FLAO|nr:helix-turn-helix transcriptional regulator [Flavivirga aquimarina]MDO5972169.1 helix-turn-helix transcriptional regulator [Flavivirga aquimarina]
MEFKDKLKRLIKTKYSKLGDLANKFGMNYTQLSQYVNGRKISMDFLYKIIEEFPEADLNWLLRDDYISDNSLKEGDEPYKSTLTKKQIVDKMERLFADLKGKI